MFQKCCFSFLKSKALQNCRASKPIKVIYLQKRSLNLNTAMGGAILHCVNALKAIRAKIGTTPPFTACDALKEINEYVCTPINSNTPGSTPLPSFTAEELMQFDCLTELNILIAQYAAASNEIMQLAMILLGGGFKYGCPNPYADFSCCQNYQQTGVWNCPECPELKPENCGIVPVNDQTEDWRDCIENCLHTGPNPGYGAQCWLHFVNTGEWMVDCFQLLVDCEHCSDLVGTTLPDQQEIDCLRGCFLPGMGQCLEYYDTFGVWTKECQDLSIECGCREEEGNEEDEMSNCAADCPNPRATECAQYYQQHGVWMDGCEEVMRDCGCYDPNDELDCYKKALNYIRKNLTFEPNNACEVLAYVQTHFNCVTQEIVRPDKPVPFPDLNLPTPDPDSNDDLPDEDGPYDERERKLIWWYHSDHLGSSTYLTDNFGRPSHYYETLPFGEMIVEHNQSTYNGGQYENAYKFNGKELDDATQMYYYGARYYNPRISIFISVDPLAEQTMEPYLYTGNNPIMFTDPTKMSKDDWVLGSEGIYWDNNATSQATTKKGDTYLGTELKFTFTSYIDKDLWDGTTMGGFIDPSGVKLTSSLTLTGKKNSAGELTSIASRFSSEPGPTPVGTARNFYPGEGGSNNYFNSSQTSTGVNFTFEQHASVSPIEESGLNARGFKIVDVAQKM